MAWHVAPTARAIGILVILALASLPIAAVAPGAWTVGPAAAGALGLLILADAVLAGGVIAFRVTAPAHGEVGEPLPVRVDLQTGKIRVLKMEEFKGRGRTVPGGAATVLDLPLDASKELQSLAVRALANEVVIGLMSVTLQR